MEWEQIVLLEDEAVSVDVRLNYLHGWEWTLRHRDGGRWSLLDSGMSKSCADALARAADALVDLAHAEPF